MRFSTQTEVAIELLIALCHHQDTVPLQELLYGGEIQLKYAEKILGRLRRAGLVGADRGRYGGYRLARQARHISLWQIIQAVDGTRRPRSSSPAVKYAHTHLRAALTQSLGHVALSTLAQQ